eukprot:112905-Chlamydomonas_euryale.AAC.2
MGAWAHGCMGAWAHGAASMAHGRMSQQTWYVGAWACSDGATASGMHEQSLRRNGQADRHMNSWMDDRQRDGWIDGQSDGWTGG